MKRPKGYQGNKAFLAWLKRQGIKESTAKLYAANSPPPAAEKWIKKYNEAFSSAVTTWPITPAPEASSAPPPIDVELPYGGVVSTRNDDRLSFPAGQYLMCVKDNGGIELFPCSQEARQASTEVISAELSTVRQELQETKEKLAKAIDKWSALQGLLSTESIV